MVQKGRRRLECETLVSLAELGSSGRRLRFRLGGVFSVLDLTDAELARFLRC